MKNYLVIGNPIDHSLSPKIHNYWIKKNNINANYSKKLVTKDEIEQIILQVRKGEIDGINVTVPHKKTVISYVDDLSPEAKQSKSVNTIYKENNKVIGHNTDIEILNLISLIKKF
jgi:shikimate dehydrogenase